MEHIEEFIILNLVQFLTAGIGSRHLIRINRFSCMHCVLHLKIKNEKVPLSQSDEICFEKHLQDEVW
jgi:hypothetical protein